MMTRLVVAALLLPAAAPALAADKVKVRKKEAAAADAGPGDAGVDPESSRARRQHKKAAVFLELGFTFTPIAGVRGEYFLDANNLVTASYLSGSADVLFFRYDKTLVDVKFKHFFTNTFYLDAGLGLETFKVTYDVAVAGSTGLARNYKSVSGTARNVGAEVHIGNQWQWSGFSLGCDWVGYFAALSKSFSAPAGTGLDASDKADRESDVKGNLNAGSAHAVRLYVGWAF